MPDDASLILDRLDATTRAFTRGPFVLQHDLAMLQSVLRAGAPEATIFYAARILETLTAEAMSRVGLTPSASVLSNLDQLQQFSLIPATSRYWAHALRRMGNDVRHLLRAVSEIEARQSVLLVERWIEWFFCRYRVGPLAGAITLDGRPIFEEIDRNLRDLMHACDSGTFFTRSAEQLSPAAIDALLDTPSVPAVIGEMLLDRGRGEPALHIIDAALERFPVDARLLQLRALCLSRQSDPECLKTAREILEPLYDRHRQDPEIAGILAGVYKRLARNDPQTWMSKSHRTYLAGWKESRQSNTYLGINAATTALWLGRNADAIALARAVEDVLLGRLKALKPYIPGAMQAMSIWDRMTLAEAMLIRGDLDSACATYQSASRDHASELENIAVARKQAESILRVLRPEMDCAAWWTGQAST